MIDVDDEIVREFLEESRANLDQLDRDLVALEGRPTDADLLARVFRTIHTIKGTCGFLGYHRLEALTHAGEDLLSALRDGDLVLDAAITTSLLRLVDAVRDALGRIADTGADGAGQHPELIAAIRRHLSTPAPPTAEPALALVAIEAVAPVETTIRIDIAVLDTLMDLVGELVQSRSQIGELQDDDVETALSAPYRRLRLVTNELRDGVQRARIQPIGIATGVVRRVVRDLAAELGKTIRVEIEGEEIGVDKAVNEVLRDPLLHLVRNAVDHGIEEPAARARAGKPAEGLLSIRAYQEGGRVHVELSDDGAGIDVGRLVDRAVERGLLSEAAAAALTTDEALALMFRAGLSTKDAITTLSGRGVGLDVVHSAMHLAGGSIHVTSTRGHGTTMRVSLPLTLAVVPTLVVRVSGARYLLPQADIEEIVRSDADDGDASMTVRGRTIPLLDLAQRLGLAPASVQTGHPVVIVRVDDKCFGLVIDAIDDVTETTVKPLTAGLRSIPVFSGVALLGDGHPALVLDVAGLSTSVEGCESGPDARPVVHARDEDPTLLIVHDAGGCPLAIPLATVLRIERVPTSSLERSGRTTVARDLGDSVPLLQLTSSPITGETVPVVLCASAVGPVGLLVHRVGDLAASLTSNGTEARLVDVEQLVVAARLGESA